MTTYSIHCWSEFKKEYVPTDWGTFESPTEAREFGRANIKSTEFIVLPN